MVVPAGSSFGATGSSFPLYEPRVYAADTTFIDELGVYFPYFQPNTSRIPGPGFLGGISNESRQKADAFYKIVLEEYAATGATGPVTPTPTPPPSPSPSPQPAPAPVPEPFDIGEPATEVVPDKPEPTLEVGESDVVPDEPEPLEKGEPEKSEPESVPDEPEPAQNEPEVVVPSEQPEQ